MSAIRPAKIEAFVYEGRVRVAQVRCPFCAKLHEHAVPVDILPYAELVRSPKCGSNKSGGANYRLVMPEDWIEKYDTINAPSPTGGRVYKREIFDGRRFGGLIVLSDGPDVYVTAKGKQFKRRQFFARCECGRVALILVTRLARAKSCGCAMGRPKDHTEQYEAWIRQGEQAAS